MSCCNTKVRAIVFDFGGALLDWTQHWQPTKFLERWK